MRRTHTTGTPFGTQILAKQYPLPQKIPNISFKSRIKFEELMEIVIRFSLIVLPLIIMSRHPTIMGFTVITILAWAIYSERR